MICLDSGCGNYEALWATTSLRGLAGGTLTVEVLKEGVHSGAASGTVPSSFRILRTLLACLEPAMFEGTGGTIPRFVDAAATRCSKCGKMARIANASLMVQEEFELRSGLRVAS